MARSTQSPKQNEPEPGTAIDDPKLPQGTAGAAGPVSGTGGSDPLEGTESARRTNDGQVTTGRTGTTADGRADLLTGKEGEREEVPGQMSNEQLGLAAQKRRLAEEAAGADSRVEALKVERRGFEQRDQQANVEATDAQIDGLTNPAEDKKDHDEARKNY